VNYKGLFDLTGQTAVVIGAASGIGRESAKGLSQFGARVVCADRDEGGARETASQIGTSGGEADTLALDITDPEAAKELLECFGTPDIAVMTPAINVRKHLTDITDEEFDRVINVNLRGNFRLIRDFGRAMAQRGHGSLIAFSSIRAQVVEPGQGVYAATKAGVLQLIKVAAAEFGPAGVRANVIAPGVVETPLTAPISADEDWYGAYRDKTVIKRWAQPDEMVGAVIFLASRASSYVTGSYLVVDGGWLAADGRFEPPMGTKTQ
jgi:NAD(P)-dependent dehydrogenase (short-subunit alcohol dehydrogenase family)